MISTLRIQNYQSHKDTEIELSPTVTVFTGESDQGKTAILRAFRKLVRNIPTGDFFIRYGQKDCTVTMTVDGKDVVRKVGKKNSINLYEAGGVPYNNFGVGIPEEVKQELRIADVQVFEKEKIDLNIRTQHEGLFLAGGTGVETLRGRIFGKVTGSDVINRAVTNLNSTVRAQNKERVELVAKVEVLDTSIASLAYLDILKPVLDDIEKLSASINEIEGDIQRLRSIRDEMRTTLDSKRLVENVLSVLESIEVESITSNLLLVNRLSEFKQQLSDALLRIKSLKGIEILTDGFFPDLAHEEALIIELRSLQQIHDQLASSVLSQENVETELQKLSDTVVTVEGELEVYKQELGVCPVCEKAF